MKMFQKPLIAVAIAVLALPSAVEASAFGSQAWYGFYLTKGGLQMSIGPFDTKISCEVAKYDIPFGSKWLGCRS